ncbi:MAG TPA: MarP family serine protease [Candidatus Saccharimonadales bacterium]|nr:MarP family serine protease [Candidatus Saccharimonadales bacterium]
MNALDIGILIFLLADIVRGARIGFSRQFFSFAGFWGGLFVAALVAPTAAKYGHTTTAKAVIVLGVVLVIAVALSSLGEYIGMRLAHLVQRWRIQAVDAGLGGLFGAVLVCLSVWLVAAMVLNLPDLGISQEVQQSRLVRLIDGVLPPAPPVIARIQRLIDPNGFPQVFLGPEPQPGQVSGVASTAEVSEAVGVAGASTVKVEGFGCNEEVAGSGFVVAPGLVVTNAHVVAGITNPLVIDDKGVHTARPVLFDPNLDLAVLRVGGLDDPTLPVSSAVAANGAHSVVLGYPGGGSFTATPAAVIQSYLATGRNIYDEGITERQIYELEAVVIPGNSGGPLVAPGGTVLGVVFARSEVNSSVGYALTSAAVLPDIHKAENDSATVSTGGCVSD